VLIGIISKPAHSKNHTAALRKEGYSVIGLGSSPTEIPPSVDLLVLRTQSCSHGGSDTAYYWNRATKKPLIVENGLSGIRSQLRKFALLSNRGQTPTQTPTPKAEESMLNFTGTLPRDFAPQFPAPNPPGVKLSWKESNVPWVRLKRAFQETLSFYQSTSPETVVEIRSTFQKARVSRGQTAYFASTDIWNSRKLYGLVAQLEGRPLHFFFFLQWCLLESTIDYPTVSELQYAYANFCGSSSMKSYVTAALWVGKNQILPKDQEALTQPSTQKVSLPPPAQNNDDDLDHLFDQVVGVSSPEDVEGESSDGNLESSPKGASAGEEFSQIRRDLEDFVLEFASNGQEILSLVKSLRAEVSALREEVKDLKSQKGSSGPYDPIQALLALRDQGVQISLTFGDKS
jgi:hypothetical protein